MPHILPSMLTLAHSTAWCQLLVANPAPDWRAQAQALTYVSPQLSAIQRTALAQVYQLGLMRVLVPFRPLLAGTIPLDIPSRHSDLDILCCVDSEHILVAVEGLLHQQYGKQLGFTSERMLLHGVQSLVCRFDASPFPVEIMVQTTPTVHQRAWRHLLAEAQLLLTAPPSAVEMLRRLKSEGWTTESAFTEVFHLPGDPYIALENLAPKLDDEDQLYRRKDLRRRSA